MAILTITKDNFEEEVLKSEATVLLDFWAPWCGPCKMIGPVVEAISEELENVKVGKINVDDSPGLAAQFKIMSIPTLIVFKNGVVVETAVGVKSKQEILDMLA